MRISLRDTTYSGSDDVDLNFFGIELLQRTHDRLKRAAHIGLKDNIENAQVFFADTGEHILNQIRLLRRLQRILVSGASEFRDLSGLLLIRYHNKLIACLRNTIETQDLNWYSWSGRLHILA